MARCHRTVIACLVSLTGADEWLDGIGLGLLLDWLVKLPVLAFILSVCQ